MPANELDQLHTLGDIRRFVAEGYRASGDPSSQWNRGWSLSFGFEWGKLPLSVAEPGPLIEHAVRLAGGDGLTLRQVRDVFSHLGAERLEQGLAFARSAGLIRESREMRPNRAGRLQQQVVLYPGEA
jgi:hypothetical protein